MIRQCGLLETSQPTVGLSLRLLFATGVVTSRTYSTNAAVKLGEFTMSGFFPLFFSNMTSTLKGNLFLVGGFKSVSILLTTGLIRQPFYY